MAIQRTREELKKRFQQGAKPSETDFFDLFASGINLKDDYIQVSENPEKPLSITGKGKRSALLDFYDEKQNNTWRIIQNPIDANTGLDITDKLGDSKLYIEELSGKVGLGTNSPKAQLEVRDAENTALRISSGKKEGRAAIQLRNKEQSGFNIQYNGQLNQLRIQTCKENKTTVNLLTVKANTGDVEIKGTVKANKFEGNAAGLFNIPETFWKRVSPSDQRLKVNVEPIRDVLDRINQLTGVFFEWKEHPLTEFCTKDKRQIGFIADEVEKVFPELVILDEKGYKHLEYANLTAVLLQGIKELTARIQKLEA